MRRRRASANRALLNLARHGGQVLSEDAWSRVKRQRAGDPYMAEDEITRLLNAWRRHDHQEFRRSLEAASIL